MEELDSLKREVNLKYILLNNYNFADLFLFKEGLSLIVRTFSFNSNANTSFLFSLVSTLKPWKDGEWLQSRG